MSEVTTLAQLDALREAAELPNIELITIPKWEYELLVSECKLLNHLRQYGVEQWEGYSEP